MAIRFARTCVLIFLWIAVPTAVAQDDTLTAQDKAVLASLADESFAVRQAATHRLLQDDGLTQDDLNRLYVGSETYEQRHRLLRIARHHEIRRTIQTRFEGMAGSGSMGLSHAVVRVSLRGPDEPEARTAAGVMAALTLPGFPAYAAMQPGDVIIEFDGQPIPDKITGPMFQQMIQARRAGDTIDLTLVRGGETQKIQMTLSHSQALREVYQSDGVVLHGPYRQRWEQTREQMSSLIETEDVGFIDPPPAPTGSEG